MIGQYGRGAAEFCEPSGVAVDTFGNFVIGDSKSNKIKVFIFTCTDNAYHTNVVSLRIGKKLGKYYV